MDFLSIKKAEQGSFIISNLTNEKINFIYSEGMGPCFHIFGRSNFNLFLCHADSETNFIPWLINFTEKNPENLTISIGRTVEEKNRRPSVYDDKENKNHLYFLDLLNQYGIKIEDHYYSFIATKNDEFISRTPNIQEEVELINLKDIKKLNEIITDKSIGIKEKSSEIINLKRLIKIEDLKNI